MLVLPALRCSGAGAGCCGAICTQEECDLYAPFECHNKLKATLSTTVELVRDGYAAWALSKAVTALATMPSCCTGGVNGCCVHVLRSDVLVV